MLPVNMEYQDFEGRPPFFGRPSTHEHWMITREVPGFASLDSTSQEGIYLV